MFVTALTVNKLVEDLKGTERDKLCYEGPLYIDWDSPDINTAIEKVKSFMAKMVELKFDLTMARWYISGGKGFHCEVPSECFMEKPIKGGVPNLPVVYREMVYEHYVDTIDLGIYSQGRGRMWRQVNVKRENARYKVPVTVDEINAMDEESYVRLCCEPRPPIETTPPQLCIDLAISFDKARQKVDETIKARGKIKRDPKAKERAKSDSVRFMMSGVGLKPGVSFHPLALQLGIIANTAGMSEDDLIKECELLILHHVGDGNRYNTPAKREQELRRMWRYTADNPMYDFSIGAIKVLLSHKAPDLDGIAVDTEDLKQHIVEEEQEASEREDGDKTPDEYNDIAGGVALTKFGVYVPTEEGGKKRICAVSFQDIHLLVSTETGQMVAYEAMVLVNGRLTGRQTIEMETFQSVMFFNRFCQKLGHQMQGAESHLRGLFMRFIELAKKKGRILYIAKREGLDIFNIPNHEDTDLREPFLVWADSRGVILDPRVRGKEGLDISFQGFPDPRGLFKTDMSDAPKLKEWVAEPGNQEALAITLRAMMTCQKADVMSKFIGWFTACFYRTIFHKAYGKFPLLHVNGAAGAGKSLRKGTLVVMADGGLRRIEDVRVGDQLLGPDGDVRNVLALGRGQETMYEVIPAKGDSYFVNESHILSLKRSYRGSCRLPDGTYVPADQEILNVPLKTWIAASAATQKLFKGYRAEAVEFHGEKAALPMAPYVFGAWLGDGHNEGPTISKPYCNMVRAWQRYGESLGLKMYEYRKEASDCPAWRLASPGDDKKKFGNPVRETLRSLAVLGNKHIPKVYKTASVEDRFALIAGMLDSDGSVSRGGYDWISKDRQMAEDFVFVCRSVGLAAYLKVCAKGIKARNFTGTYYRVSVSGDCERIPCLDKKAPPRRQIKSHLVTGLTFKKLGVEGYYGVVLDKDHLFLLGDFTATHNTEMSKTMAHLFFYNQEPKALTPQSTPFAIAQHMTASASIPLLLDEYKPHEMDQQTHNRLKLLFRDAYNMRDVMKGGGNRDSDDYRSLSHTQLAAPLCFIAEAAEEESAVAERIVLLTVVKPASSVSLKWLAKFQVWERNKKHMAILGQYLAAEAINTTTIESLQKEFDVLFVAARNKFMLTEDDLAKGLDEKTLSEKQGAKERSVFNFTVALFGLLRFKRLVTAIYGAEEFAQEFIDLEGGIYTRMNDLQPATQAEWAKVMDAFSTMSYQDPDSQHVLRKDREYAVTDRNGRTVIEVTMVNAYLKYRAHCRTTGSKPLFNSVQSFLHSIKDSPALIEHGFGPALDQPGVYIFDVEELQKLKVGQFK